VIRPGKAHLGVDFTTSAVDHKTGAVITGHGYRGGPWVIDAADAAKAMPIINAWQTANPDVAVHEVTTPFWGDVARRLIVAPTIAMHQDGNEKIARSYLQAAGIPDSTLDPAWPVTSPDMLTPAEVAGPTTTNHHDGKLFDADGDPVYCQFMSMHWGVNEAADSPETVVEVREFLKHPVHFFAECQAVNAFEGGPPVGGRGNFLTTQGFVWPAPSQPKIYDFSHDDSPFAQLDGVFQSVGGSEPAYSLPAGGAYSAGGVVMITKSGTPEGDSDVWMSGFLDGVCPPETENCSNNYGKVSYLGGHQYTTSLPISKNPSTQGTRLFLDSLFEAPCATASGQPEVAIAKSAPSNTGSSTVTFTIGYQNSGPGVARTASLSDQLPPGSTFVSASAGYVLAGGKVTWNLGNLGVYESGQVTLTVSLAAFGSYTNTAHIDYKVGLNSFGLNSNTTTTVYDTDTDGDGIIDAVDICPNNYNPAQNLQTDIQSCGACGTVCAVANGTPVCGAGQCGILSCQNGFSDCDGLYATGCEYADTGFQTDVANCGGCRKLCAPQNANAQCSAGTCSIASCTTGFSNCNGLAVDGCEYNDSWFPTDSRNCSGCGITCTGGLICRASACVMNTCTAGQADCDGQPGCEVNTNTDPANCGGCGLACSPAHATGSCNGGTCAVGTCAPGFSDCDGLPGNGCEYDNTGFPTDPNNCGSCGAICAPANGSGSCTAGVCKIVGCAPGFSDCDGLPGNGCEYDNAGFPSDPNHCGGCGTACAASHAAPLCTAGSCKMGACDANYVDVDGKPANGCECHKLGTTDGTCDGVDDDCNGLIDDAYVPFSCGTGACASKSRCVNGSFVCAPGGPAVEGPAGDPNCADGVDNDCDGLTDDADSNCAAIDGGSGSNDAGTTPDASTTDAGGAIDGSTGRDAATTTDATTDAGGSSSGGAAGSGGATSGGTGGSAGSNAGGTAGSSKDGGAGSSAGGSAGTTPTDPTGDEQGGCGCRIGARSGGPAWPAGGALFGLGLALARVAQRRSAQRKERRDR
jgi:uncharacterized repeat protein (TIGR01451 family)